LDRLKKMKKQFLTLWILCQIGTIGVLPYIQAFSHKEINNTKIILVLLQSGILYGLFVFFGLKLAHSINFRVHPSSLKKIEVLQDVIIGIILASVIYALDTYVFKLTSIVNFPNPPFIQKFMASLYGAFNEEVSMRLFLMSLLIKGFFITFKPESKKNIFVYLSIFITALVFGAGHLPAMAELTPLTSSVITRTLILNGLGGIIFGWLYFRKSLTSAMIAHGVTDITLGLLP